MPARRLRALITTIALVLLPAGLALVPVGCTPAGGETSGTRPLLVYATIYPLYDFAGKIAGDRAEVRLLLPPGADTHTWEPGTRTLKELEQADLLLYNGAGLEPWVEKVAAALAGPRLRLVDASRGVALLRLDGEGGGGEAHQDGASYDPHVWLDPERAKVQAANIREALAAADPAGKDYYEKRFRALARRLDRLDTLFRLVLEGATGKEFVVSHAAFGYLAARYGLVQLALTGGEGEAEPGPADLAKIIAFYRRAGTKYLFVDGLHGAKAAAAVAREVGAEVLPLYHLSSLTEEQMAAGEDYFSLMEENLLNLYRGLE